jgi:hypothetical protein
MTAYQGLNPEPQDCPHCMKEIQIQHQLTVEGGNEYCTVCGYSSLEVSSDFPSKD